METIQALMAMPEGFFWAILISSLTMLVNQLSHIERSRH